MKKTIKTIYDNKGYLLIFLVAAVIRAQGIQHGLPDQLNIDEVHLVSRAIKFGSGDLNPHFFFYPAFHMYLLFAFYGAAFVVGKITGAFAGTADFGMKYFIDPTMFYIIARSISVFMGAATAVVTGLLADKYYGRRAGIIAGVFMCFTYMHAVNSHYATTDIPMTFWMMLALLAAPGPTATVKTGRYALAGALVGVAMATKYSALIVVPAIGALWIFHEIEMKKWEGAATAGIRGPIIMGVAAIAAFAICAPYTFLDFHGFKMDVLIQKKLLDNGWLGLENINNMWTHILKVYMPEALGATLWAAAAFGTLYAVVRRKGADIALLVFLAVFYVIHGKSSQVFARYMVMATPVLCVLAARLVDDAAAFIKKEGAGRSVAAFVISFVIIILPAKEIYSSNVIMTRKDTRTEAREWIEKNVPSGTRMAVEFGGPQLHPTPECVKDINRAARYAPEHIDSVTPFFAYKDREPVKEEQESEKSFHTAALEKIEKKYDVFTSFSLAEYPLKLYKSEGYEYIVINSGIYDRYFAAEKTYPAAVWFYRQLELDCELEKEFKEEPEKRTGPGIKIYGKCGDYKDLLITAPKKERKTGLYLENMRKPEL